MIDRFFLGVFFVILLLLGGCLLYERAELDSLETQVAQLDYEVNQLKKEQRVMAQDSNFMLRLVSGAAFKEIEDE